MTTEEAKREAARLWIEKSDDALLSARREAPKSPATAISRAYYACFYAASAVLIMEDRPQLPPPLLRGDTGGSNGSASRHSGVRDAVFKHLVQTGRLPKELGNAYRELMEYRHQADYETTGEWTKDKAQKAIDSADRLTASLKALLPS
jgi:uncharacterized protein (UPF0332 family)